MKSGESAFSPPLFYSKRKSVTRSSSLTSSSLPLQSPSSLVSQSSRVQVAAEPIAIRKEPLQQVKVFGSSLTRDALQYQNALGLTAPKDSPIKGRESPSSSIPQEDHHRGNITSPESSASSKLTPMGVERKLKSYGPYIRVYERNYTSFIPKDIPVQYTSIFDATSNRLGSSSFPTISKTPPGLKQIIIGSPEKSSRGSNPPSTIISLARPSSNRGTKYAKSVTSSSNSNYLPCLGDDAMSPSRSPVARSNIPLDPSIPLLPFLNISNALQLHLQMNVLDSSERILVWATGSFLLQAFPFVKNKESSFSFISLFNPRNDKVNTLSSLTTERD
jgi:hypothetical protein